jgi:hypothetical protein
VIAILACAALFYGLLIPQVYVGYFNDDALYTVAAKSLLQGHYVRLYHPLLQPFNHPLPGYPAFLAPFVAILQPHWAYLKLVNIGVTLGTCVLLWNFLKIWLKPQACAAVTAIYAFNPLTVSYASSVMPEPCFLFFILGSLHMFHAELARTKNSRAWILSGLLAWTALVRPEGIIFVIAVGAGAVWVRRKDLAGRIALSTGIVLGGVLLRNYLLTHSATNYLDTFKGTSGHVLERSGNVLNQFIQLFESVVLETVLTFSRDVHSTWNPLSKTLLILFAIACAAAGFVQLMKGSREKKTLILVMGVFGGGYLLIHAFWPVDSRYFLPILPFWIFLSVYGLMHARVPKELVQPVVIALGGILLCLYIRQDIHRVQKVWTHSTPASYRLPTQTLEWIRSNTAPEAIFLGKAPVIYLYTGRQGVSAVRAQTPEEFRDRLKLMGIAYALIQPRDLMSFQNSQNDPEQVWGKTQEWLASNPKHFVPVYQNPEEETIVYRLGDGA